jgi:hypothetical protein
MPIPAQPSARFAIYRNPRRSPGNWNCSPFLALPDGKGKLNGFCLNIARRPRAFNSTGKTTVARPQPATGLLALRAPALPRDLPRRHAGFSGNN